MSEARDPRSFLAPALALVGYSHATAEELVRAALDAERHDAAEEIRNSVALRDLTDDHMGDCNAAADLIDRGVKK
jgi:hypothetical protein